MCITLVNSLGSAHPPGAPEFASVSVRPVLRNLQLYVWSFVDCCLSFCPFSIGYSAVCLSSISGFWLTLFASLSFIAIHSFLLRCMLLASQHLYICMLLQKLL